MKDAPDATKVIRRRTAKTLASRAATNPEQQMSREMDVLSHVTNEIGLCYLKLIDKTCPDSKRKLLASMSKHAQLVLGDIERVNGEYDQYEKALAAFQKLTREEAKLLGVKAPKKPASMMAESLRIGDRVGTLATNPPTLLGRVRKLTATGAVIESSVAAYDGVEYEFDELVYMPYRNEASKAKKQTKAEKLKL